MSASAVDMVASPWTESTAARSRAVRAPSGDHVSEALFDEYGALQKGFLPAQVGA